MVHSVGQLAPDGKRERKEIDRMPRFSLFRNCRSSGNRKSRALAGTLVSRHCPPGGRCCKLAGHQKTYFNANCKIRESRAVRICPKVLLFRAVELPIVIPPPTEGTPEMPAGEQ